MYFTDLIICGSECERCQLKNEKLWRFHFVNFRGFMSFSFSFKCMKRTFLIWDTYFYKIQTKTVCCLNFELKFTDMLHGNSIKAKKEGYIFLFNKKPWKLHGVESLGNPLFLWKNVVGEIGDWHHNEQNIVRADTDCQLEFGLRHWLLSAWCLPSKEDGRCKTESFLSLVNVVYTSE